MPKMPDCSKSVAKRVTCAYKNESERFVPQPLAVTRRNRADASLTQYFVLYRARLAAMRPRLLAAIEASGSGELERHSSFDRRRLATDRPGHAGRRSGDGTHALHHHRHGGEATAPAAVGAQGAGRRGRDADADSSYFQQASVHIQSSDSYVDAASDSLTLEDDQQVIALVGQIDAGDFVTGVVVAVSGQCLQGGRFAVDRVFTPVVTPQRSVRPAVDDDV